jgi:type I restriction enzyme, R subunit
VIEGMAEDGKRYTEGDFNRTIEIREREAYRVKTFMGMIDQREKTLVFCATQEHAGIVRDLINQEKTSTNPNYCVRVTAQDGAIGDQWLRTFQDNDKTIPTILTTSQKLSTGVDARNVRNIVLMRPVNSMIEFKQIIGRGTRLFDGKDYFTILDFVKAYEHFNDPEWDGEPLEPEPPGQPRPQPEPGPPDDPGLPPDDKEEPKSKLRIKLADGKERTFQHISATTFWDASGKPVSAQQFIEALFGKLPELFKDEDELRAIWGRPDTRRSLIEGLAERGFGGEPLEAIRRATDAQDSDLFDVLAYIAFLSPPLKRAERVEAHRDVILSQCEPRQREFLDFVLSQYVQVGESELDSDKLPELLQLKYGSPADAIDALGSVAEIRKVFHGFQRGLYEPGG